MSVPKLAGIETEHAIAGVDPRRGSVDVVAAYARLRPDEGGRPFVSRSPDDLMLACGARFYVDHAHPELSTAESPDPLTVAMVDRAGAVLVQRCATTASTPRRQIRIYKNNSDHQGHSYGAHENFLMDAGIYAQLFGNRAHWIFTYLVPFLLSRMVYTGAGKVGSENGAPAVDYQLSQRADFLETIIGPQTVEHRPIVNTRDEPHADHRRFRRLHVIVGDATMCPYATWLKIGTAQIVLRLLEEGALDVAVLLADPLRAACEISHDVTCTRTVDLEDGRRWTAVDIQRAFLECAQRFFASHPATASEAAILNAWQDTLDALRRDPEELTGRLDWVTKRQALRHLGTAGGWDLTSVQAVQADIRYHALDPAESIFGALEAAGAIVFPPGWDPELVERYVTLPPTDSRAWTRGRSVDKFADRIVAVDWEHVTFGCGVLELADPLACTEREMQGLLDHDDPAIVLTRVAEQTTSGAVAP